MAIHMPTAPIRKPLATDDDWSAYAGTRMRVEDFLALDDAEETNLEYVDGLVLEKAVADRNHRNIVGELDYRFGGYKRIKGGEFGPEARVRLASGRYRKPDTAYWAAGTDASDDALPTVAVEVWSPGETMASQRAKCRMFLGAGVKSCWLINPKTRTVEVFEAGVDGRVLRAAAVLESGFLAGFSVPLPELFAVIEGSGRA